MRSILISLALLAPVSFGQELIRPGKASDVRMSDAVLRAGAKLYEDLVAEDGLRGVVLLVARKGQVVLHEAHGWRDEEKSKPMRKDSLFRMASNTKPVVATAVLQLVESGKLALDAPVSKYLPAFDNAKASRITVRHLLTHTAGFRVGRIFMDPLVEKSEKYPDAPSLRAEVDRFGAIGAQVEPGTSYRYSNPGYNTLGALIEVASGMPLKAYLREKIYQPLGMKDSCNHEPDADHGRMSAVFRRDGTSDGKGWRISWRPGDGPDYPFPRASGGMISTALDYARFCQMYLNGGTYDGKRLLGNDLIADGTRAHTRSLFPGAVQRNPKRSFYGHGWSVRGAVHSHGGSDGTHGWVDKRRGIIGIVFTQSPGGRNPKAQFQRIVNAACWDAP